MAPTRDHRRLFTKGIQALSILAFVGFLFLSLNAGEVEVDTASEEVKVPKPFSKAEIRKHDTRSDCWTVIDNNVYDMTFWQMRHPGGSDAIVDHAGYNMTRAFAQVPHSEWAKTLKDSYLIGYATELVPEAPFMSGDEPLDEEEDEYVDNSNDAEDSHHNDLVGTINFNHGKVRVDDLEWWKKVLGSKSDGIQSSWKPDDPCFGAPDRIVSNTQMAHDNSATQKEESEYVFERFMEMKSNSPKVYEKPYSQELGKRLIVDHRMMSPDDLDSTPSELFYIRTGIPVPLAPVLEPFLNRVPRWDIAFVGMKGDGRSVSNMTVAQIMDQSDGQDQGRSVMECSGNTRRWRFGLISQGHWTAGVPVIQLLAFQLGSPSRNAEGVRQSLREMGCTSLCSHVLVEGYDRHSRAVGGRRGASWIFSLEQVIETGMFLATELNGRSLSLDHGFPVRLVVPRWYGCTHIKWVTKIAFVNGKRMPPTSQMLEFRTRVHMPANPRTLSSAAGWSAQMGLSATATRVEVWRHKTNPGKVLHKVVGLMWGDDSPRMGKKNLQNENGRPHGNEHVTTPILIRLKPGGPRVPVTFVNPRSSSKNEWTQWCHVFNPIQQGGLVGVRDIRKELLSLGNGADVPRRIAMKKRGDLYKIELLPGTRQMYSPRLRKGRWGNNWYSAQFDFT